MHVAMLPPLPTAFISRSCGSGTILHTALVSCVRSGLKQGDAAAHHAVWFRPRHACQTHGMAPWPDPSTSFLRACISPGCVPPHVVESRLLLSSLDVARTHRERSTRRVSAAVTFTRATSHMGSWHSCRIPCCVGLGALFPSLAECCALSSAREIRDVHAYTHHALPCRRPLSARHTPGWQADGQARLWRAG